MELLYNRIKPVLLVSSGLFDFKWILLFIACGDYRGISKWGANWSSILIVLLVVAFLCTHDRCLTALVYLRTCTVGECLRINDLHFLAARWRGLFSAFPWYSPALAGLLGGIMFSWQDWRHLESGNNLGSGASVGIGWCPMSPLSWSLCILCTLCADGTV